MKTAHKQAFRGQQTAEGFLLWPCRGAMATVIGHFLSIRAAAGAARVGKCFVSF
jgi:hypothetical protein